MKSTAEPPSSASGSAGEEATKYIFRFKVDLDGKKRRRGSDGPQQGAGGSSSSSSSSTSSSSSHAPHQASSSCSTSPAPPAGIEQYLSKTRIKLQRDKQAEERKQHQAQLQSILKQHQVQLQLQTPQSPSTSSQQALASATVALSKLPAVLGAKGSAAAAARDVVGGGEKPKAGGGGGEGGFDVAAFLSEANARTVHPLGAGLFHKKRGRGLSGSPPAPRAKGKRSVSRSDDNDEEEEDEEEEEEEYEHDNDDGRSSSGSNDVVYGGYGEEEEDGEASNEIRGPRSGRKSESEGERSGGWRKDSATTAACYASSVARISALVRSVGADEVHQHPPPSAAKGPRQLLTSTRGSPEGRRRSEESTTAGFSELRSMGGRRLATTAQFFPNTPPPGLAGLLSPSSSFSSLSPLGSSSPSTPQSALVTAQQPRLAAHAESDEKLTMLRRHLMASGTDKATAKTEAYQQALAGMVRDGVVPLRQDGRHLSFVYEGLNLMKMFESCIWNYTPLHPSILHESSVRRILCGSEEDMGTPLALSVNVGLAMASFWLGNAKRGNEFYRVARHHLAYLFDSSSYEVAEALLSLGVLAYGQGDFKRFGYFVNLAVTICRRIGAYNSDIYAKCVIATVLDPLCSSVEKARILADYSSKAPVSPYYDSTRVIFPEHTEDPVFNERSRILYSRYGKIREADRHLSALWTTLKEWEQRAKAYEERTSVKPLPQAYMDEVSLAHFLKALLHVEAMLEAVTARTKDYLGDGFHTTIMLFRLAARAQYHLMRGDEAKSWHWISRFAESIENAHTTYLSPTTLPAYQTFFDVLLHFKRADLVRNAMAVVRDWANVHPVCSSAVEHYLQLANTQTAPPPVSVPVTNPPQSRRCDAYLTSPSNVAVHVTDSRPALQANVGGLCPSDRFVSVTDSRQQQQLPAGQQPTPMLTTTTTTTAFEHLAEGRAWGYAGRESGQDIVPHGRLASPGDTTSSSGRESWSGGVSLDVDERPPPIGGTAPEPGARGLQRLLEGVYNGFGDGGHKDRRSSFDWAAFLQDLETNNT